MNLKFVTLSVMVVLSIVQWGIRSPGSGCNQDGSLGVRNASHEEFHNTQNDPYIQRLAD